MKIPDRLRPLLEEGLIHEVVRPLMSGKEAAVYIVHNGERYCVAKVYKDAEHRSFRQRTAYTEGRQVRNSRQRRAMEKGSKYGKEQQEAAWQTAEVDALAKLAAAGVRVNAVAPGPVQTDMLDRFTGGNQDAKRGFLASLPARRAGAPEEIAQTIVFLASDKARFLTGQCVAVDGGYTAQ